MINNARVIPFTLLLLATFSVFPANRADAQSYEGAEKIKRIISQFYQLRERELDEDNDDFAPGMNRVEICKGFYTVDYVYPIGDPHLDLDDVLYVVGPIPVSGNYQVTPVSGLGGNPYDHPWKNDHYTAKANPSDPGEFDLEAVPVAPHGNDAEREHDYVMEITDVDEDGCPTYLWFESLRHTDGPIFLDPGHAGAGRG